MDVRDFLNDLNGRHVVFCNWRDSTHPRSGGAETYCEEIARRFVAAGAEVTLLTARASGQDRSERRDGIRIIRRGNAVGVYLAAAAWLVRHRSSYDAVIDFQNGLPFFAPVFAGRRKPVVCVVHHVHQDQFDLYLPHGARAVARFLEGRASKVLYGSRPIAAVSPSTRSEIRRRLALRGPIHVVPNGATPATGGRGCRSHEPRIVCVSRLVSHKRLDRLVEAAAELRTTWPDLRIDVAGSGPEEATLRALIERHGLTDVVRLHGHVSESHKHDLLASAWLTVNPSTAEGWGLTVIEANSAGVPAVAVAVPGLSDSIIPGVTGWLAPTERQLVSTIDAALAEVTDPVRAERISKRCRGWAERFHWDDTANRMAAIVSAELERQREKDAPVRRTPTDLTVVAEFGSASSELVATLHELRRTDAIHVTGDVARVLLPGCDELQALRAFERIDLAEVPSLRLATSADLLVPAGAGGGL